MNNQDVCPICQAYYGLPDHRQMMVCMNQHALCAACLFQISQKDARCPYCKKAFRYEDVKPLRLGKEPRDGSSEGKGKKKNKLKLCPFGHRSGTFSVLKKICNSCGKQKQAQYNCKVCLYNICHYCLKPSHEQICGDGHWKFDQSVLGCNICEERSEVGRSCGDCQMRVCRKHEDKYKREYCGIFLKLALLLFGGFFLFSLYGLLQVYKSDRIRLTTVKKVENNVKMPNFEFKRPDQTKFFMRDLRKLQLYDQTEF